MVTGIITGRFYGGFWQQVGSEYRKKIYINDNPTVEVDYKGLHAAIVSAKNNVVNDGDRYDLGTIVCPRLDKQQQRKAVKLLVLAAINAKDSSSPLVLLATISLMVPLKRPSRMTNLDYS